MKGARIGHSGASPDSDPRRLLNYGRPDTPIPAVAQWLLGVALALVVVTVVGLLFMVSQEPVPGICGALAASRGACEPGRLPQPVWRFPPGEPHATLR